MTNVKTLIMAIFVLAVIIVLNSAFYTINETEQVIITQFGAPVGDAITEPGVHFKMPFIQKVNRFEKRFLEWNGDPNQVPTKDKTFIYVDTYARWRISDPLLFFQKLQNESRAQSRLDDILDGSARIAIANNELAELIRSSTRDYVIDSVDTDDTARRQIVEKGRAKITEGILESSKEKTRELGIELLDFRFKRIKYADEVQSKIYDRMISERKKIAEKFRSEGRGAAAKIQGDRERDLNVIQSNAYREAEIIKGKADAEATRIYANAYDQNADSRDFYQFLKTMETYKQTLSEKDMLILSTKSDFFKYLRNQRGN
ncbi:MAG: protease modulator HflC [Calditrichaeota bacterium]|nr:protease modulator HflC [Calditrichota bacterium]